VYTNAFSELLQNFTKIRQMALDAILDYGENRGQATTGDNPRLEGM